MIGRLVQPQVTEYLHRKASRSGIPLNGTFELTPCCNMACKMCYVRMTKKEQEIIAPLRSAQEWLALAERIKKEGMLYLLLTGGEPFLRPDFREILSGMVNMGLIVSINSNGTLIDESVVEWLKETPPFRINITLYGASNETYARLCGNPNGFTQTVKAIRLLKNAGISVKINCSVTPHNVNDVEAIYAFAKEEGLFVQGGSYMFPPLRRNVNLVGRNERFTPVEAAHQIAKINLLMYGEESFLQKMKTDAPLEFAEELDGMIECSEIEGDGVWCRAGKCAFWVTWDGRILPCGMFPGVNAENVFDVDFSEAWEKVKAEIKGIRLPAKCSMCEIKKQCRTCAAMVLTETGGFSEVPKYRCEMAKSIPSAYRCLEQQILNKRSMTNEK